MDNCWLPLALYDIFRHHPVFIYIISNLKYCVTPPFDLNVWFCAGAAAALLLSAFVPNVLAQTAVFLVVSLVCLVLMRPLVRKKDAKAAVPTNADRNVGQTAEVIAAVEPARPGRARLSGVDWAARCDVPLAEGQLAEVVAVEGTTLVLRPAGHTTRAV